MHVTGDSTDPLFEEAYIDVEEERSLPVPHRYVHGGFRDSQARFSFYFPPKSLYEGRFHHNTYPLAASEDVGPFPIAFDVSTGSLGFSLASGAYYVQTNNGGMFGRGDPSVSAYRANAAAARFSRSVAARLYGSHRPFGYLYGGSGGAYQTMGGAEHTCNVWDGFMPFVVGCNDAIPSMWGVRLHALRILNKRDKFRAVVDAVEAGGSGDMYAGLNDEEREALQEATRMGYPPRGWYNYETLGSGYFSDAYAGISLIDPGYEHDFWNTPGYLGHDDSASFAADRIEFETTVARVIGVSPQKIELSGDPDTALGNARLTFLSGTACGHGFHIASAQGAVLTLAAMSDWSVLSEVRSGDRVRVDNAWLLAAQTYQRHQVPGDRTAFGWDQYRDGAGEPIYPQRDVQVGHTFVANCAGSLLTGRISGKMLVVQALMDIDALPWSADWYRSQVARALGRQSLEQFALWFIDHTQHDNPSTPAGRAHTVSLSGPLQQGLRDLARWVEKGIRPNESVYQIADAQVIVRDSAKERGGIQPVVTLLANGASSTRVAANQTVVLEAVIDVPPDAGEVIAAEWDFEGSGDFAHPAELDSSGAHVQLSAKYAYEKPGTYFAVLRATSQRDGDRQAPYARIQNLARVRVVVGEDVPATSITLPVS